MQVALHVAALRADFCSSGRTEAIVAVGAVSVVLVAWQLQHKRQLLQQRHIESISAVRLVSVIVACNITAACAADSSQIQ